MQDQQERSAAIMANVNRRRELIEEVTGDSFWRPIRSIRIWREVGRLEREAKQMIHDAHVAASQGR